jgi:hypothetical protein
MSESENSRARNVASSLPTNKGWLGKNALTGYALIKSVLGKGENDSFSDRGRGKTPADWDNEVRAHELRQDINHHYGTKRAEGDLDRANRHLGNAHATTPDGRVIQRTEYDGKGGYKLHYGEGAKSEKAEDEKKPAAKKRTTKRKPGSSRERVYETRHIDEDAKNSQDYMGTTKTSGQWAAYDKKNRRETALSYVTKGKKLTPEQKSQNTAARSYATPYDSKNPEGKKKAASSSKSKSKSKSDD